MKFLKSRLLVTSAILATMFAAALLAQSSRAIGALVGRTDSSLNLFVRAAAAGAAGSQRAIGNLVGRTDASLNLYVVFDPLVAQVMGPLTTVGVGTGTATAVVGGTLNSQFTPVSNTSIAVEDVLITYTMPAATLATDGRGVRIIASGIFTANVNTKSARVYFGGTLVHNTTNAVGAPNGTFWRFVIECVRVTATTQSCSGNTGVGATGHTNATTPAETLSGAVVIKVSGFSATAATDVTARSFLVEAF